MREFEYIFDQGLMRGLRKEPRNRSKEQTLVKAHNVKADKYGLEAYEPLPFRTAWKTHARSIDSHYPKIFNGSLYSYLITKADKVDHIYIAEINPNTFALTNMYKVPMSGDRTFNSFADFGKFHVLSGDIGTLIINRETGRNMFYDNSNLPIPIVLSWCAFRGQLVGGNVKGNWNYLTTKHVMWSDIGAMNVVCTDCKGEVGNMYIPTSGDIVKVLPLREHVIVYSTTDVFALTPVITPAPTFKLTKIGSIGIKTGTEVDGDEHTHLIVSADGTAYTLSNDLQLNELGYREFLSPAADSAPVNVIYDKYNNEWRISCNNISYLLTSFGLTTTYQYVTGVYFGPHSSIGAAGWQTPERNAMIITDDTDFGYRGIKTIHGMEIDSGPANKVLGDIQTKYSRKVEFVNNKLINFNDVGQIGKVYSGTNFRIVILFAWYKDFNLDYIKLRYKMSDMRGIRGVYAPPPRGQFS